MLNSFSTNVITTKAKSMYGKRIKLSDYQELTKKNLVAEVASYLKHQTRYSMALSAIQETTVHRNQLENLLNRDTFYRYLKLAHYDNNKGDSFYKYPMINLDIQQILSTIRFVTSGQTERIIEVLPAFVKSYTKVNFMKLADVKSFDDLITVLDGTPYSEILKKVYLASDREIDIGACEIALRTYYFEEIYRLIDKNFRGKKNKELKNIFSTQVEIYNITTIYRLKSFYNLNQTEIMKFIIPVFMRIPSSKLIEFIETKSADEFINMISKSSYGKFFDDVDYTFIEYTTQNIKYYLYKRYMNFSSSAPTCFAAYMVLSDIEIENLTTIIEGIRYKVSSEQIEKLLIL